MIIPHSVTLFLGWMAESARNGTIYADLFILLVLVCLSPLIIGLLWSLIKWITKNDTDQGSDNRLHESQQYSSYSPDSRDRTQYSPPKATIDDSKQKLVRTRLRKFDLSEEEAKLVFGERWDNILCKKNIRDEELTLSVLDIQTKIMFVPDYREKVIHIIDKLIPIIDSVIKDNPKTVKKYLKKQLGTDEEIYIQNWEFFKVYKKTWHPDRNKANKTQAEQMFVKINRAYETILDNIPTTPVNNL